MAEALSLSKVLNPRSQYPKFPPSSSSLKVSILRTKEFLLTAASKLGILSLIFQQQEHHVAVKQSPRYLKSKSLRFFSYPVLLSTTGPSPDKPSMKFISLLQKFLYEQLSLMQQVSSNQDNQFFQGYKHLNFLFCICIRCFDFFKKSKQTKKFIFWSFLTSALNEDMRQANKKLHKYIKDEKGTGYYQMNQQEILNCFEPRVQKSQSFSLTTEDTQIQLALSQNIKDSEIQTQRVQTVIMKCQATIKEIAMRIDPGKAKIQQTKQSIKKAGESLIQKYRKLKSQYRNIKAQLPGTDDLAKQAKRKISSFFKIF